METLRKELSVEERKVINEYQEYYSNSQMLKEAKQWEKAGIESWLKYEKDRSKKN